jgi:phage head maturation protease
LNPIDPRVRRALILAIDRWHGAPRLARVIAGAVARISMSTIRRSIRPNAVKFASNGEVVGARQVLAIVSSEQRDRMGDVILQDGIDYSDFLRGGGTVLWQHDANYPVARTVRLSVVNGCLTALAQFPPEGTSEKSDECYRLIRDGVVNSTSIGFMPVDWEFIDRNRPGSGVLFREIQML